MLNGMEGGHVNNRFLVGFLKPHVKSGQYGVAEFVSPGNIKPRLKPDMIHLKARNFFHDNLLE
jgi:hypothetical protein